MLAQERGRWAVSQKHKIDPRNHSRRLLVTLAVYTSHVDTDPSVTNDESLIQTDEGHKAHQPSVVHGRFEVE